MWRGPKPRVRTAVASARGDPTRTASFVALVIAVWRRLRCSIIHQLVVAG